MDEQKEQLKRHPLINPVAKPLGQRIAEDKAKAHEKVNRDWTKPGIEEDIEPTAYDMVNKPKHYMLIPEKEVEVIDVISAAVEQNGIPAVRAHLYSNVLKYMLRCGRKGRFLEDLKKAQFYLNRMIENIELNDWNARGQENIHGHSCNKETCADQSETKVCRCNTKLGSNT